MGGSNPPAVYLKSGGSLWLPPRGPLGASFKEGVAKCHGKITVICLSPVPRGRLVISVIGLREGSGFLPRRVPGPERSGDGSRLGRLTVPRA